MDCDLDVHFAVEGHPTTVKVSVSPVVDKLLLGRDWLVKNGCQWDFLSDIVRDIVGDVSIRTHRKKDFDIDKRLLSAESRLICQEDDEVDCFDMLGDVDDPPEDGLCFDPEDCDCDLCKPVVTVVEEKSVSKEKKDIH